MGIFSFSYSQPMELNRVNYLEDNKKLMPNEEKMEKPMLSPGKETLFR